MGLSLLRHPDDDARRDPAFGLRSPVKYLVNRYAPSSSPSATARRCSSMPTGSERASDLAFSVLPARAALAANVRTSGGPERALVAHAEEHHLVEGTAPQRADVQRLIALAGELFFGSELGKRPLERAVDGLERGRKRRRLAANLQDTDDENVGRQIVRLRDAELNIEGHGARDYAREKFSARQLEPRAGLLRRFAPGPS